MLSQDIIEYSRIPLVVPIGLRIHIFSITNVNVLQEIICTERKKEHNNCSMDIVYAEIEYTRRKTVGKENNKRLATFLVFLKVLEFPGLLMLTVDHRL